MDVARYGEFAENKDTSQTTGQFYSRRRQG